MWENDLTVSMKCITNMRGKKTKNDNYAYSTNKIGNYNTYVEITLYVFFTK